MGAIEKAEKGFLTVAETASELGIKEATIRAWLLRRKHLAHVKFGRTVRIARSEIERLIRESTVPAREWK